MDFLVSSWESRYANPINKTFLNRYTTIVNLIITKTYADDPWITQACPSWVYLYVDFFSTVNTTELHNMWLADSMDAEPQKWRNHGYGGLTINYTHIFNCTDLVALTPALFKGQLHIQNWKQGLKDIFAHSCSQQHYFTIAKRQKQPKCPSTDE